eukprot:869057-Alexandrium_andersonii.AAC.1
MNEAYRSRDLLGSLDLLPEPTQRPRGSRGRARVRHAELVTRVTNEVVQVLLCSERGVLDGRLLGVAPCRRAGPPVGAEQEMHSQLYSRVEKFLQKIPD